MCSCAPAIYLMKVKSHWEWVITAANSDLNMSWGLVIKQGNPRPCSLAEKLHGSSGHLATNTTAVPIGQWPDMLSTWSSQWDNVPISLMKKSSLAVGQYLIQSQADNWWESQNLPLVFSFWIPAGHSRRDPRAVDWLASDADIRHAPIAAVVSMEQQDS